MRLENPFQVQNLGNGRVKFSLTINFKLIVKLLLILLATCIVGALLFGLGMALYHIALFLWGIKWWLLGALGASLIIYLLTKVNWKKIKLPEPKERKLGWLLAVIGLIIAVILGALLFRSCSKTNREADAAETEVTEKVITVTEDNFKDPGDWIQLDCYLSQEFNIQFANYEEFAYFGEDLSYIERCEVFDEEQFFLDWSPVFSAFEGKSFKAHEIAALKRYALWCGPNGFPHSPVYKKLVKDEEITAVDLSVVYTSTGGVREYESQRNAVNAKKYAWMLMNVYSGVITVDELLDARVMTYKAISLSKMYNKIGEPIFSQELKKAVLNHNNGARTTREVLDLYEDSNPEQ